MREKTSKGIFENDLLSIDRSTAKMWVDVNGAADQGPGIGAALAIVFWLDILYSPP